MDGMVDDSMESLPMGSAPYSNETYAYIFWYIVAASLAMIGIVSWSFELSTTLRKRAKAGSAANPASTTWTYTIVSLFRETSYIQLRIPYLGTLPTTGNMMVCAVYIAILLSLLLSNIWADVPVFWEAMALRSGYLAVAQLALLIALSTKKNLIAYLTHSSHERIIVFHRLIGICVLMTCTLHMGYFLREWLYYNVWKSEWEQMGASMLQWGFAAWGILVFLVASSLGFVRSRFYETWIVVHIVCMIGFFAMVIMHLDPPYRPWAYVPLIIWGLDRAWRLLSRLYLNTNLREGKLLRGQARLEVLSGGITQITISNFPLKRKAGQYAYVSIYSLGINSHPFTIVSSPDSANLVFMMKAKAGLTRALHSKALSQLPPNQENLLCSIEGPYGGSHTSFQSFDTSILIAGGIGATFIMSLLLDVVTRPGCCRKVKLIWVVKSGPNVEWFKETIASCTQKARHNGVQLDISVWVTCDEKYTSMSDTSASSGTCGGSKCQCRSKNLRDSEISIVAANPSGIFEEKSEAEVISKSAVLQDSSCCCSRKAKTSIESMYDQFSGRPNLRGLVTREVEKARGETGIAVCGPTSLTLDVRKTVVQISDERASKKGSGAEAIYLHVENQQ